MRSWIQVIVWCVIIFVQSSYPSPGNLPQWPYMDKILHACAYGLLGALLCRALCRGGRKRMSTYKLILISTVAASLYGLSDEWHQSFVIGRQAEAADWLADSIGGLIGSYGYLRLSARLPKKRVDD